MVKPRRPALAHWPKRLHHFFEELPVEGVSPVINRLRLAAQFLFLVWRGFAGNRCPIRAAALSYTTLLALVPLLAVGVSVSKNFLHESSAEVVPKLIDKMVETITPELESAADEDAGTTARARQQAVEQIQGFIDNINAGTLGTVGTLFLVFVAIRLLMTIEQTFNDIWGIEQGRSIWRKVVYYWTSITLGSMLLMLAIYLTGRAEFLNIVGTLRGVPGFEKVLLRLVPFAVLWVAFALLYALMPNTRVRPMAAIAGGVFGGTLWQLNNWLSTLYVSRVVTYSKIYGAIGIIPVFLVGLYFSWLIVLLGAQVSYATQNIRTYLQQRASERIDQRGRELVACRVVFAVCQSFIGGLKPPDVDDLAERLNIPPKWLNQLVHRLTEGGVLAPVASERAGLVPARPPDSITVADVLQIVRSSGTTTGDTGQRRDWELINGLLDELQSAESSSPANLRFSELVGRLPATPAV